MSTLDKVSLVWIDCEHDFNVLGKQTDYQLATDSIDAKRIVIWKEISFMEFFKSIISSISGFSDGNTVFDEVTNALTLVLLVLNLFPLSIETIENDEHAEQFLHLIKVENGEQHLLKQDLEHFSNIDYVISFFISKGILTETDDAYVINGTVLNSSHLIEK